ncbi:hypothetical protein C8P68_10294 [Mucilaginibacter yixingensis]|uniref:Uncharacterized protein n=1 Tax=Mucilaginibacter yixingensis TaxID=1295612 RepID=A0A2T5JC01_9SPHI|nr:hypothetical protein [Mucilaginibacter yixingensis]PTQ99278.1 hypothetical protein C8P68_10294 [Mucilaginibacter yixingensis]
MDIQTEKIALAKRVLDIEDEILLKELKTLLEVHGNYSPLDLPDYVKEGVEKSRRQVEEGQTIPHNEVMGKYPKYYKHL